MNRTLKQVPLGQKIRPMNFEPQGNTAWSLFEAARVSEHRHACCPANPSNPRWMHKNSNTRSERALKIHTDTARKHPASKYPLRTGSRGMHRFCNWLPSLSTHIIGSWQSQHTSFGCLCRCHSLVDSSSYRSNRTKKTYRFGIQESMSCSKFPHWPQFWSRQCSWGSSWSWCKTYKTIGRGSKSRHFSKN